MKTTIDWICLSVWGLRGATPWSKLANLMTWTTALTNSMKLSHAEWGDSRRVGHGGEIWQNVVHWRGNSKPLQYACLENAMNSMKRQNDRIVKEELPRLVGAQYATGDQWRNNSRKNEGLGAGALGWPRGMVWEGGGFRMGNTCIPVVDSFRYLAKPIQYCKV